jgi:polyisoprenoid-binding protein YceI
MIVKSALGGAKMIRHTYLCNLAIALLIPALWAQTPSPAVYSIDATRSKLEVDVFRAGLLKMMGHDHNIAAKTFSGEIRLNSVNIESSSVTLNVDSASLVVLDDPGVPEKDRKQVQETMLGAEVLNVKDFPKIQFHSTGLSHIAKTGEDFTLAGRLRIHGVEKEITFPVHIRRENHLLRATGSVTLTQTDFGIKPVKAALGSVRVKDQIMVRFELLAERANP